MINNQSVSSTLPTYDQVVEIHIQLLMGRFQHHIAAEMGMNQGRISEVKNGKRFPESREEALRRFKGANSNG